MDGWKELKEEGRSGNKASRWKSKKQIGRLARRTTRRKLEGKRDGVKQERG